MQRAWLVGLLVVGPAAAVACGGSVASIEDQPQRTSSSSGSSGSSGRTSSGSSGTSGSTSGVSSSGSTSSSGFVIREPLEHRTVASACDDQRPRPPVNAPDGGAGPFSCQSHADCTAGKNGRCSQDRGNWYCTYDACFSDFDCNGGTGGGVCECEGGFRSDHNVCLFQPGCRTDADCVAQGKAWCSPTFGSCGAYSGTTSYQCHTTEDECTDDADCKGDDGDGPFSGRPYCGYDATIGHWKCSTQECAG